MEKKKYIFNDEILQSFSKLIYDFVNDIVNTFPEKKHLILDNVDLNSIYSKTSNDTSIKTILTYCCDIYPSRFFDILYKNEDIFINKDSVCYFLPGIDFSELWKIIEKMDDTKNAIWKYLQLILFMSSQCIEGLDSFGDTAKMFEAINENDLLDKLKETIGGMTEMFDISENFDIGENDISLNIPDAYDVHSHLKGLLDGNLGKLAHEIAEETANDLQRDMSDSSTVGDVFQKLMKNPGKLINMIKKVGSKLDEKIKSGELKESELMKEASDLMEKMKNMPGMGGMDQILSKMGVPTGKNKINFSAMQSKMKTNIKQASQRERMLKKLESNRKARIEQQLKQENLNNEPVQYEKKVFQGEGEMEKSKRNKRRRNKKKKNKNKNKN